MNLSEAFRKIPELLLHNKFVYNSAGIPISTKLSYAQKCNLIKCGISTILFKHRMLHYPPVIHLEPSSLCNLNCNFCPAGENTMKRARGLMSMETFHKVIKDLGNFLITVSLYSWGESFLNKKIPEMINEFTLRNINTVISTNGHFIETLEDGLNIVDSGLTGITICIDGSTQEIYSSFRKGGELEKVKKSVLILEEAKKRKKSPSPYTNVRLVVTKQNQDDIVNVERLAVELRANMFSYKTMRDVKHVDKNLFKNYEPTKKELCRYKPKTVSDKKRRKCIFPFRQPTIFWDGTLVGCEADYDLEIPFGKVGEEDFMKIWNSPNAMKLRKSVLGKNDYCSGFCSQCYHRDSTLGHNVLYNKELKSPE